MKIFFDFELDEKIKPPFKLGNPVYDTLKSFLDSRYAILEDDIAAETGAIGGPFVVLSIDAETAMITIHKAAMSDKLSKRVSGCVSQEDFKYLANLLRRP